ncbi:MAG TPA: sulfatase-like hydrolase/transferase [Actinomycetota bacterium]|nr:sulfatase-like hydrolase/transferase [Actinomycetota bacterium]
MRDFPGPMTGVEDVPGDRRRPGVGGWDVALSILVAFNFAVAQPILDLTGKFPQFFLARRSPRSDLVLLAVGLAIAIPAVLALVVLLVRLAGRRIGTGMHVLVVGGLTASLALQLLARTPGLDAASAPVLIGTAVVVAGGIVVLYYRSSGVRTFVRLASITAVLLPALFLFSSPASKIVIRQAAAISGSFVIGNAVPVVVLVLDELPIASLMNAEGGIDAEMHPNFAKLAATSTWFRNATAVHDFTEIAVPAILTGSYGDKRKLPITSHYPQNIFTLLGGAYDVHAAETFTQLCPPSICTSSPRPLPAFWPRWRSMISDLGIVYEHVIAPPSFQDGLPSIDQTWSNFGGTGGKQGSDAPQGTRDKVELSEDPIGDFRAFTRSISPSAAPALWFAHVELPHAPWRYLPSGQQYVQASPIPGRVTKAKTWGNDEWLLAQAYQRHLLQTAAVDREIGALVAKLKATGLFDKALVVITADHGVSFRPESDLRVIRKETAGEIAHVPMFVKLPGQRAGAVVDRPVQTFDVVPTIADVLDVRDMYPTDGISMFAEGPPLKQRVMRSMRGHRVTLGLERGAVIAAVQNKVRIFGSSGGVERLYGITPGAYGNLLGMRVAGGSSAPGSADIDFAGEYERFDPEAAIGHFLLTGTLRGVPGLQPVVAVSVRGKVVAVTRAFVRSGRIRFYAMIPPDAFQKGANPIAFYLVDDRAEPPALRRILTGV